MIDYQTISALNQSTLKKILISPQEYIKAKERQLAKDESTEQHFIFGSLVDSLLTETKQDFDNKYAVIPDTTGVTDTISKIVQGVYQDRVATGLEILDLEEYYDDILQHCQYENYQSNWKEETRVNKIIAQGSKYFEILKETDGKTIVTETDYAKAVNCVMALRSDKFTRPYCQKKSSEDHIEIIDKHVVQFKYNGLEFKGEIDRIIVDHKNQTITPIDFKTTGKSVLNFENSFWHFRYDFQAAVYDLGLHLDKSERLQKYYQNGYSINRFLYIVVETHLNNNPMVFEITKTVLEVGIKGNKEYEGFNKAIERYKYATENDAWDYPMEYYKQGKNVISVE